MKRIEHGFFITFEGPEGAGKTTQMRFLQEHLTGRGYDVLVTREPGGTPLGEELRRLIKYFGGPDSVTPRAELLMFGASRAQLMQHVIGPHLERGGIVLCDRFADSTTVYQGMARGLDREFIDRMHRFTLGDRLPNLTLLLDLPVRVGFERAGARNGTPGGGDRIEAESAEFHERVRRGFLELAAVHPDRFRVIRADCEPEAVRTAVTEVVNRALG